MDMPYDAMGEAGYRLVLTLDFMERLWYNVNSLPVRV